MSDLAQHVVNALSSGSLMALYALGITLTYSIVRLVNFAYGELIMAAAYTVVLFKDEPLPLQIAAGLAVPILLGLAMDRLAFRRARGSSPATLLVISIAISLLVQSVARLWFGGLPKAANFAPDLQGAWHMSGVIVPRLSVVTIAVTAILFASLAVFLRRARLGLSMRAAAEDFEVTQLMGVRAGAVIAAAFAISGALAGVAGLLRLAARGSATPDFGLYAVLFGLVAAVIGGLGSLTGAVAGGYLMGAVSTVLQVALPESIRPSRDAFVFVVVFGFLVIRPGGLFRSLTAGDRV